MVPKSYNHTEHTPGFEIPYSDRPVHGTRRYERLPDADVQTGDSLTVKGVSQLVEGSLFACVR